MVLNHRIKYLCLGATFISLQACLKDEIPVPAPLPGSLQRSTVEMTQDYRYQLYYDLETDRIVGKHLKSEWDLGFSCGSDNWTVRLNSAKSMLAVVTTSDEFAAVTDTATGYNWKWDLSGGSDDSTAIGDARKRKKIILINAGYDEKGQHQGLYKIRIDSANNEYYYFTFAEISRLKGTFTRIKKEPNVNQVLFSFITGGKAAVSEPDKTTWDLIFTQYTQLFEGNLNYLVTGALLNPFETNGYVDSLSLFSNISRENVLLKSFSGQKDIPGYGWKSYIFSTSSYQIHTFKNYVFKTQEGFYWKLRFTDFYNNAGQSGYPAFEFQQL